MNSSEKVVYATGLHRDAEALIAEGKHDEATELLDKAGALMDDAERETKAIRSFDELKGRIDAPVNELPVSVEDQESFAENAPRSGGHVGNAKISHDFRPAGWMKGVPAAAQPVWVQKHMGENQQTEARLYEKAFETWMRSPSERVFHKDAPADYVKILNETTNADGGFTVPAYTAPDTVINSGAFGNQIAPICRQYTVSTDTGTLPTVGGVSVAVTAESASYSDQTPTFTGISFNLMKFTVSSRVTEELLADSASNVPQMLAELFDTAFGQNIDVYITNVVLASTAADSTAASATALVAQDLLDIYAAVPAQHRGDNCRWVMPSAISSFIAGIGVTSAGARGIADLAADPYSQLMGKRVINNDNSTNLDTTLATGNEVAILGDWNQFALIRKAGSRSIRRLDERYADVGEVGFISSERNDQEVLLPTAFKILKMA